MAVPMFGIITFYTKVMSDIITVIGYRQCIFRCGFILCAECTFIPCIFTVYVLGIIITIYRVYSYVWYYFLYKVQTVYIYVWFVIVSRGHFPFWYFCSTDFGIITFYRVYSYVWYYYLLGYWQWIFIFGLLLCV